MAIPTQVDPVVDRTIEHLVAAAPPPSDAVIAKLAAIIRSSAR